MFLQKKLAVLILIFILYIFPDSSFAVTCCVDHGGEYACNYTTGELYCKDGTLSKDCTCRRVTLTPTLTPTPTPMPTTNPTLPSCVANSTYDKNLKICKCNSGYTADENSCISYKDYCWHNFGSNSTYDSSKEGCVCSSGYLWNTDGNACISYNKTCQNRLGINSYYNSQDNTCNCYKGYSIIDDECELIPTPVVNQVLETKVAISSIPYPSNTPIKEKNITSVREPTKEPKINIKDGDKKSFVTDEIKQKNIISRLFEGIWSFISNLF